MNSKQELATFLQRSLGPIVEALPDFIADLNRIGSLEQQETEAKSRLALLASQQAKAKEAIGASQVEIDKARTEAVRILSTARDEAKALQDKAAVDIEARLTKATSDANEIIAAATKTASAIESDIANLTKEADALRTSNKSLEAKEASLTTSLDALRAKLA